MVRVSYKNDLQQRRTKSSRKGVFDFSKGQNTQFEADKLKFESFSLVQNMIHKKGSARVRRGYVTLDSPTDPLAIGIYEAETEKHLYAVLKDGGSNSKLTEISRSDGTETDRITGITGQGTPSLASLRGYFYMANSSDDIQSHKNPSTNATITLPSSLVGKHIASDGERLWATTTTGVLLFSTVTSGAVTSFTQSGTDLSRAGVGNSDIVQFTAMKSSGRRVLVCGNNRIEVHETPNFASAGITTFPADIPTLKFGYNGMGTASEGGAISIGNTFYIKPETGGSLIALNSITGETKQIKDNFGRMDDLYWDDCQMSYDQADRLLLIAGKTVSGGNNDIVIAYNVEEGNFSEYTNIDVVDWAHDESNVYFLSTTNKIEDAFQPSQDTDNGVNITTLVRTNATYFDSDSLYKKVREVLAQVRVFGPTDITLRLYADRGIDGNASAAYTKTLSVPLSASVFEDMPQAFGLGVWGAAGLAFGATPSSEKIFTQQRVNVTGVRFEMEIEAEVDSDYYVRSLGITAVPTLKQTKTLTFDS
jgi:hypothetical protein